MGRAITEAATSEASRPIGRVKIKNTALKPRRLAKTGPPTTRGVRPGRNEGSEWLHRPTTEHVFHDLPPENTATHQGKMRIWPVAVAVAVVTAIAALSAAL